MYMAPEQLRSAKTVDPRADIWAIGVILFQLMAGRLPFDGQTIAEIFVAILEVPAPPLRAFRPDLPPALEAVVMRCLARDPAQRFGNVAELAAALAPFAPPSAASSFERVVRSAPRPAEPPGMPSVQPAAPSAPFVPSAPYPSGGAYVSGTQVSTNPSWAGTQGDARRGSGALVVLGILAALVLVAGGVGVAVLVGARRVGSAASRAVSPPASTIVAAAAPPPSAPPTPAPDPAPSPATSASPATSVVAPSPSSAAPVTSRAAAAASASAFPRAHPQRPPAPTSAPRDLFDTPK